MSEATTPSPDVPTPNSEGQQGQPPTASDDNNNNNNTLAEAAEQQQASRFADTFDKEIQAYGHAYIKKIMEMSKQKVYTITLNVPDPSGKKEPDPWEEGKEREVYIGTEKKDYKPRPISAQDYHRAEKLRAKFQNEKDPDNVADNQARIYQFLSFCYLGMSPTEFNRVADWTELKLVVDACNHKTLYQPGNSNSSS